MRQHSLHSAVAVVIGVPPDGLNADYVMTQWEKLSQIFPAERIEGLLVIAVYIFCFTLLYEILQWILRTRRRRSVVANVLRALEQTKQRHSESYESELLSQLFRLSRQAGQVSFLERQVELDGALQAALPSNEGSDLRVAAAVFRSPREASDSSSSPKAEAIWLPTLRDWTSHQSPSLVSLFPTLSSDRQFDLDPKRVLPTCLMNKVAFLDDLAVAGTNCPPEVETLLRPVSGGLFRIVHEGSDFVRLLKALVKNAADALPSATKAAAFPVGEEVRSKANSKKNLKARAKDDDSGRVVVRPLGSSQASGVTVLCFRSSEGDVTPYRLNAYGCHETIVVAHSNLYFFLWDN